MTISLSRATISNIDHFTPWVSYIGTQKGGGGGGGKENPHFDHTYCSGKGKENREDVRGEGEKMGGIGVENKGLTIGILVHGLEKPIKIY